MKTKLPNVLGCITALILLCFSLNTHAQLGQLLGWQFSNPATAGTEVTASSYYTDAGMEESTLSRGAGFNPTGLARGFSSNLTSYGGVATTKVDAINDNVYYELTIKPKTSFTASLSAIEAKIRRSSAGAKSYRWMYSINGAAFVEIGSADGGFTDTNTDGVVQTPIDLSGIADLQNIPSTTTVRLRIYAWEISSTGGTTAFARYAATDLTPVLAIRGEVNTPTPILAWQFGTPATTGSEISQSSTTTNSLLNSSSLVRGAGFLPAALARSFNATATEFTTSTKQTALDNNEYYEFDVTPNVAGKYLNLQSLQYILRRTTNGADNFRWQYSRNGAPFVEIGTADVSLLSSDEGVLQSELNLQNIAALQNIPTNENVKFRLYAWGATTAGGAFAIGKTPASTTRNSLALRGTISNTLPISLVSFSGKNQSNGVKLTWQTASEQNNSHFEILRSGNDKKEESIAIMNGKGNSNTLSSYFFTDHNPLNSNNYYTLKQFDFDGKENRVGVFAVNTSAHKSSFQVLNNGDLSFVSCVVNTYFSGTSNIQIIDLAGQVKATSTLNLQKGNHQIQIPASLAKGIYVATFNNPQEQMTIKFSK